MLQFRHIPLLLSALVSLAAVPGCASEHFFPRLKPLFAGLDETKVPASAKSALAQAKADFRLVQQGREPRYARYVETIPYTHSKVFVGKGYRLIWVNKDLVRPKELGPDILLDSSITGGKPYRYDDIDRSSD